MRRQLLMAVSVSVLLLVVVLPCCVHSEGLELEWDKKYEVSLRPYSMAVDSSGNVVVVGERSYNDSVYRDGYIMQCDENGSIRWRKTMDIKGNDSFVGVAVDSKDNIIAVGQPLYTVEQRGLYTDSSKRIRIVKYDPDGNLIWNKTSSYDERIVVNDVALDSRNNIIVVGNMGPPLTANCMVAKFSEAGEEMWNVSYGDEFKEQLSAVDVDSQDNIVVAGIFYTENLTQGHFGEFASSKYHVATFDEDGRKRWGKSIEEMDKEDSNLPLHFEANDVVTDSTGSVIATGAYNQILREYWTGNATYLTVKYTQDGERLWKETYRPEISGDAGTVTVDAADNIYVGGDILVGDGLTDIVTIVYDTNGTELSKKRYHEEQYKSMKPKQSMIDSNNLIILIRSKPSKAFHTILLKYSLTKKAQPEDGGTPGFEFALLLASLAAVVLWTGRRRWKR